jgi:P27 family predicted phage terminase small subunit
VARPGPKPKPAAVRRREGNPGKRPIKESFDPGGVPEKPRHLSKIASDHWDEVVEGKLIPAKQVSALDAPALKLMCVQWGISESLLRVLNEGLVERGSTGQLVESPLLAAQHRASQLWLKLAIEFGLTSSARARYAAADKPVDLFQELGLTRPKLKAIKGGRGSN